jgi:LuxR family maltose regulon positive regulatory protein
LLDKAVQSPLVTVTAGAGYGKTHAVYSFVRKINVRTAWIQLSGRDNIDERFWENFTAAVSIINKASAAKLMEMGFPATENQFRRYVQIPRADVVPEDKYVFVYDDLHLITNKTVLRFLEHSITSPFSNITSILISRADISLNLMKMVSRGQVAQITEEDLLFSKEEMVAYFRLQNINPSPQTASLIYNDTEGWAFAIHLASLSLRNLPPTAGYVPQALRANIFKLIESEVVAPMEKELRHFLVKLSLIDHLAANLLKELAGNSLLIDQMESIGSFIRFDSYLNAYHIHHLFLDYLTARQGELSEEEKKEVWNKTAAWCVANNQKLDAVSYYEKAGDYGNIIKVVHELFPLGMSNRIAKFLLEILDRAPKDMYRQIPPAWPLRAQVLMILEMFDRAVAELKELIATLEAEPLTPFHYQVLSGSYNALGFIGLTTCMYSRDYDYVHWFERGVHYYRLSGHVFAGPATVAGLSAYVCRVSIPSKGEIEKYIEANSGMVFYVTESMGGAFAGLDDLARAEYALFKADTTAAERFAGEALYKAREKNQYEIENRALHYLIQISIYNGTYEKIDGYLKSLEAHLSQKDYLNRYTCYDITMGWFYLQTGQPEKIALWLKNDFEGSELNSLAYGLETLVRTKYHYYEGRYHAAMAAMAAQKSIYGYGSMLFGKIFFKLLEALCSYRMDDIPGAVLALGAAYDLASPNGLDMPFIEMGKDTRTMIEGILKENCACTVPRDWLEKIRRAASAYAKKIAGLMGKYGGKDQRRSQAALSHRELEVLKGLSHGLTRKEIAGASSISVNTVKSAVASIYNKLGAINRADAVRIATEKGLLK